MPEKKFHCLVVDTTAFINNVPLQVIAIKYIPRKKTNEIPSAFQEYADFLITVPDVINEIQNKRQLKRLCVLPYDLTVDEPSLECVRHVIDFAKRTGDYLSLSMADIKVIALTYQLEKELVGTAHLRTDPVMAKTIASRDKPPELMVATPLVGFYMPPNADQLQEKSLMIADTVNEETVAKAKAETDAEPNEPLNDEQPPAEPTVVDTDSDTDSDENEELQKQLETLAIEESSGGKTNPDNVTDTEESILVKIEDNGGKEIGETDSSEEEDKDDDEEEYDEDDDDSSWITPSNLVEMKSSYGKSVFDDATVRVACMTTDYAVQNVLKQMNLNIISLDGKIIKQMRTYILRCYACFKTTSLMTKVFCPKCGHKTLKRVAVSLDENGQQIVRNLFNKFASSLPNNDSLRSPPIDSH